MLISSSFKLGFGTMVFVLYDYPAENNRNSKRPFMTECSLVMEGLLYEKRDRPKGLSLNLL